MLNLCVCLVSLSQPSSGDLDYPLWDVHATVIKMYKKKMILGAIDQCVSIQQISYS